MADAGTGSKAPVGDVCGAVDRMLKKSDSEWLVFSSQIGDREQSGLAAGGMVCVAETSRGQVVLTVERFKSESVATDSYGGRFGLRSNVAAQGPGDEMVSALDGVGDEAFSWSNIYGQGAVFRRAAVVVAVTIAPPQRPDGPNDAVDLVRSVVGDSIVT